MSIMPIPKPNGDKSSVMKNKLLAKMTINKKQGQCPNLRLTSAYSLNTLSHPSTNSRACETTATAMPLLSASILK